MLKSHDDKKAFMGLFGTITPFVLCLCVALSSAQADTNKDRASKWEGVWFTCEFAQRQSPPDDGCTMFDDEGFRYKDGILSYLKMLGSEQTACRGNKKGQCFLRNRPSIRTSSRQIGDITIINDKMIVRYWGCDQPFSLHDGPDYMTVKPIGKKCLWSQERHFYIAPYEGDVLTK